MPKKKTVSPDKRSVQILSKERISDWTHLLFIILLGLIFRLWHITWGLPNLYEEAMPLRISWRFWNWGHSGLNFNPGFFVYPAFTFYLQFFVQSIHFLIGYTLGAYDSLDAFRQAFDTNPSSFVVIARIVTILFDVGTIVAAYQLTMRCADRQIALVVALLIVLNPLHIQQGHLINVDTPLTFFVMLSLLFIYCLYSEGTMKWYVLAGISIGLATATKYNGALLVLVLITAHLLKSKSISEALASLKSKPFIVAILSSVSIFAICNPYIFLRTNDFTRAFSDVQEHMEKGHLGLDPGTSTIGYYFLQSLPQSIGWLLLIAVIGSMIYFLIRRKKTDLILLAFPVFYIATIGTWSMRAERYIFPVIPILIIIGTIGIFKLWNWVVEYLKRDQKEKLPELNFYSSIVLGVVVAALPFMEVVKYYRSMSLPDTRTVTREWIVGHVPQNSAIASGPFGIDLSKDPYAVLRMPFNAGATEKTIPFYNTQWYEDLDVVITSDYDYARYIQEPQRFHDILQFYDSLKSRWTLIYEIKPGETNGPTFWLYKSPDSTRDLFSAELINKAESIGDSSEVITFFGKLGLILSARGKVEKSEQLLKELVRIDPNNTIGHKELASVEYKLQNYDKALVEVQEYLQLNPNDPEQIAIEGDILFKLQRLDEAEPRLKEALRLNNHLEGPYVDLNVIYASKNEKEKMIDNLIKYYAILPPSSSRAKLIQRSIEKLKGLPN